MVDIDLVQENIHYWFHNPDLLQQAFTRRSYSEENGGQNNEVLEFIGDKALDLAVIAIMMDRFGVITDDKEYAEFKLRNPKWFRTRHAEGAFTDIKRDLVEKKSLARAMRALGFHKMLIMGRGDELNNIQEKDSVQEDLFEAILGAVAVDSNYDMNQIRDVVQAMIDFEAYFNDDEPDANYIGMLQEWYESHFDKLPDYSYQERRDGFFCHLTIELSDNGRPIYATGEGNSMPAARMDAAEQMWNYLCENGYVLSPYEEAVGEPIREESLRQLNELVQKGLVSKPSFEYRDAQEGDNSWECRIVAEGNHGAWFWGQTKKDAQRSAAYQYLCALMDCEPAD